MSSLDEDLRNAALSCGVASLPAMCSANERKNVQCEQGIQKTACHHALHVVLNRMALLQINTTDL